MVFSTSVWNIFHNILKCALNIFVSIAFYTLKYILPEAKHIHGSLNFAYRYMSSLPDDST